MTLLRFILLVFCFLSFGNAETAFSQTTLLPGDLAVVGVNAQDQSCGGGTGGDVISFVSFVDLEVGTQLEVTDNGWERVSPGLWGNSEEVLQITVNTPIPAGEVITFISDNNANYNSPSHPGLSFMELTPQIASMNFNSSGDQIYFLQGGVWVQNTPGAHDAEYIGGSILFGFNTRNNWSADGSSTQSNLHPSVDPCYHMEPSSTQSSYMQYTGPTGPATQLEWITRIRNQANWTEFPDCTAYNANPVITNLLISPSNNFVDCSTCTGCGNFNDVLTFSLPTAGGPFNVVYQDDDGNMFNANNVFNGHTVNISVTESITYSLFSITDAQSCPIFSNFTDEAEITVGTGPSFDNPGTLSNCGSVTFPFITGVDLTGNEMYFSGPNGTGNSFNPLQQTSNSGTYYIYDPSSTCDSDESFIVQVTPGPDLFLVQPAPVVCTGESFNISSLNVIDNNGTGASISFHTGNPATAGNQITGNYMPTNGETIFAYAEVSANCDDILPISLTTSVAPTATISGDGTACPGEAYDLTIDFTGTGPWEFQYSEGGIAVNPTISTLDNPYTLTVNPNGNTLYQLISVEDANCSGSVFGSANVTTSTINASISGATTICSGDNTNITVSFDAGDPNYSFIIQRNGAFFQNINSPTNPIVINSGPLFFQTTFTIINAQADGCNAIESAGITIDIHDVPEATISSDQVICEGDQANISIDFTGDPNYIFEYAANGVGQGLTPSNSSPYIFNVNPTADVTYTLLSFEDGNGCAGNLNGQAEIDVTPAPTASISNGGSVCEGESFDLSIDFTGEGPFTFVYTEGGTPQLPAITTSDNPFVIGVSPSSTSTYGLSSVASGLCAGSVNGMATVTVTDALTTTNPIVTCNQATGEYVVVFEISGGTAPYTVSGNAGIVTGNFFTSDPIPSGAYSFTIDDNSNCPPIIVSGAQDCSCTNNAGTMDFPPATIIACQSELISLNHNGDETVDAGDVFGFIIHESPNPEGTLPNQWNPTSATFDFTGFLMLNTTYYVSAVTGSPDPLAGFDINDPCLSVSAGVPVMWVADPTGTISATAEVCEGSDASLTFDFTGTAPFSYTYNINGEMPSIVQQTNDNQVVTTIPISENTTVILESVEDNICTATINQAVDIVFNENITAVVSDTICSMDITSYQIEITATGEAPFSVAGNSGTFVGNVFTSDPISSGDPYFFEITDANACNTLTFDGLYVCEYACTGELGDMELTGLSLCVGELATASYDDTDENIEPGDLVQYLIHANPDASLGTPILIQNSPSFAWDAGLYMPNTSYYISVISGDDDGAGNIDLTDPCLLVNEGQPLVWNQGTANFTINDTNICGGVNACIDLTIEVEGIPNYEVVLSDNMGGEETLSDFNSSITFQVCPDVETIYTISSISSNTCAGLVGPNNTVTISPQAEFSFENFNYNCNADNTQYSANFDLIGGTAPYTIVSGGGTITGESYTSDLAANNVANTIEFVDDLGCSLTVNLQNDCDCMNAPAILNTDIQELCLGEFSEIIILSNPTWGPGDVSAFYLHDGTESVLGSTIYDITNDIFNTEPSGYTPGDTLYFTPVVSEDDGNGLPDIDDSCLNIGNGFPVVWYEPSALNIPESVSTCNDDCQDFTYSFFQEGEHTLELSINSINQIFNSINGEIVVTICPVDYGIENGGQVELSPVSLTNVGGCVTDYNNSAITTLNIIPAEMTDLVDQICMGDSIIVGNTVFDMDNPMGQVNLLNQANCDSIVNVVLTFYDMPEGDFMTDLCPGGSIDIGGVIFDESNDSGAVILPNSSYLGCDSLVNVSVMFSDAVSFQLDTFVCDGNSIIINGETYDADNTSGSFTFDDGSYLGCDSIVNVSVDIISEIIFNLDGLYCADTSFVVGTEVFDFNNPVGSVNFPMGSYLACDSTVMVDLQFYPNIENDVNQTLCTGDTYQVGDVIFDEMMPSGTVVLENAAQNGCDSTVNVNLIFNDAISANLDTILCEGQSFIINQTTYDADNLTGTESFPMGSYLGCDSILNVNVSIAQAAIANYDDELCEGDELNIEGIIYDIDNPNGMQILSIPSSLGCDSIAEVNLSFLLNSSGVLDTILCAGDFALIGGLTIDEDNPSSTFTFPGMASNGCDSILTVNAFFIPATEGFIDLVLEFGESFTLNGVEFDQDNPMGEVILENESFTGCDSIVNVTVSYLLDVGGEALPPNCFGEANGSIRVDTILYGVPPYSVSIDGNLYGSFSAMPYFITGLAAGEYDVIFTDTEGSFNDSKITVPEATQLTLDLGENVEINQGETYTIEAITNMMDADIQDLIWSPIDSLDNDSTLIVTSSSLESISYSLFLQDSTGCSVSDEITIFVNEERFVYIPTAFSPNDDGFNDAFTIFASEQVVQIKTLNIFDRWGNQVFNKINFLPNDLSLGWNGQFGGQRMNNQVFVYVAEIEFIDGKTEVIRGDITLIR